MDELEKLKTKREKIRRLTSALFRKIDKKITKNAPYNFEFCSEKLLDTKATLKELNSRVESFYTDKTVFEDDIAISEEWNDKIVHYRSKISQLKNNFPRQHDGISTITTSELVTPPVSDSESQDDNDAKPVRVSDSKRRTNSIQRMDVINIDSSATSGQQSHKLKKDSDSVTYEDDSNMTVPCQDCKISFHFAQEFVDHRLVNHGDCKPYICPICRFQSNYVALFVTHMRGHTCDRPFSCDSCGRSFTYKHQLREHEREHLAVDRHACDQCDQSFDLKSGLKEHKRLHVDVRPYVCPVCHKVYARKQSLKNHALIHAVDLPHHCRLCHKRFRLKADLTCHSCHEVAESQSTDRSQASVQTMLDTGVNGDVIASSSSTIPAQNHKKYLKRFKCVECPFVYKTKQGLSNHFKAHTDENFDECRVCKIPFKYPSKLDIHFRQHINDTLHNCDMCDKRFVRKSRLLSHLMDAHVEAEHLKKIGTIRDQLTAMNMESAEFVAETDVSDCETYTEMIKNELKNSSNRSLNEADAIPHKLKVITTEDSNPAPSGSVDITEDSSRSLSFTVDATEDSSPGSSGAVDATKYFSPDPYDIVDATEYSSPGPSGTVDATKESSPGPSGTVDATEYSNSATSGIVDATGGSSPGPSGTFYSFWNKHGDTKEGEVYHFNNNSGIFNQPAKAQEEEFNCPHCELGFPDRSALTSHLRVHGVEHDPDVDDDTRRLESSIISTKCAVEVQNQELKDTVSPGNVQTVKLKVVYTCPECGKSFNMKSHIILHQKKHKYVEENLQKNKKRKAHIPVESQLFLHRKMRKTDGKHAARTSDTTAASSKCARVKSSKKPFRCATCGKTFLVGSHLYLHEKKHQPNEGTVGESRIETSSQSRNIAELSVIPLFRDIKQLTQYLLNKANERLGKNRILL